MAVDLKGQRLFVAALGNHTVEVVDLKKGERAASLSGFDEPQGIAYIPESGRVVVANGGDGAVTFIDGQSLKPLKTVRTGGDADNVRYDGARGRIYVGYGEGALAVLSAEGERIGDVPLGGHPESFQLDGEKIYVNVPSRREVAVIDADKMKVAQTWQVSDASANFPMALDAPHHRLFVCTRRPPRLLVYDTGAGRPVATVEAGGDSDDLFYDGALRRIYASFGEGSVYVFEQTDPDHYYYCVRNLQTVRQRGLIHIWSSKQILHLTRPSSALTNTLTCSPLLLAMLIVSLRCALIVPDCSCP